MREKPILKLDELAKGAPLKQIVHKRSKQDCKKQQKLVLRLAPARPTDVRKNAEFMEAARREKESMEGYHGSGKERNAGTTAFLWKNS